MRKWSFLFVAAVLVLTAGRKYPDGWQYIPLPENDEYATNLFGRSWLDPVYNGYLIVGNRYIEAPYVVEQRGFVIFVNNERVDDGTDIRLISPLPAEPAVTIDPGLPTNVTRNTSVGDVVFNPVCIQKNRYWNNLGIYGEQRLNMTMDYYRQLPCIKEVVDNKESAMGDALVTMVDYNGNKLQVALQTSPKKPIVTATAPEIYSQIVSATASRRYELDKSSVLFVRDLANPCIPGGTGAVWDTNKWMTVFRALADDLTPSQRLARIREAEIYGRISDHQIKGFLPLNGFSATPQLWQRLSGDTSWTNDAPARLFAITNGWQKITPAFLRTQNVTVAAMTAAPGPVSGQVTHPGPSGVSTNDRATAPQNPVVPSGKTSGDRLAWGIGVIVVGILLLVVALGRRK